MGNMIKEIKYNLPYDYSRCMGSSSETCQDCMRKLSPGHPIRQVYIAAVPDEAGFCGVKISVERWNNE